jgi:alpha-galactosidase
VELFIIDYDWFPALGDWRSDPERFPQGGVPRWVKELKAAGMRPGIWMGFGALHPDAPIVREHPDWVVYSQGEPARTVWSMSLCLGHPPTREWILEQLCRVIEEYEIEWLKHDFQMMTPSEAPWHQASARARDTRVESVEGYYWVMEQLHERFPALYLDSWIPYNGGFDWANVAHHHSLLGADVYDPVNLRGTVYSLQRLFPLTRMHLYPRAYPPEAITTDYFWRSACWGTGTYFLNDILGWDESTIAYAQARFAEIKERRPLFRGGLTYDLIDRQPDYFGWEARMVYHAGREEGLVQVFRNHDPDAERVIRLQGLEPEATYAWAQTDAGASGKGTGAELSERGLPVSLEVPFSSEEIRLRRE